MVVFAEIVVVAAALPAMRCIVCGWAGLIFWYLPCYNIPYTIRQGGGDRPYNNIETRTTGCFFFFPPLYARAPFWRYQVKFESP